MCVCVCIVKNQKSASRSRWFNLLWILLIVRLCSKNRHTCVVLNALMALRITNDKCTTARMSISRQFPMIFVTGIKMRDQIWCGWGCIDFFVVQFFNFRFHATMWAWAFTLKILLHIVFFSLFAYKQRQLHLKQGLVKHILSSLVLALFTEELINTNYLHWCLCRLQSCFCFFSFLVFQFLKYNGLKTEAN